MNQTEEMNILRITPGRKDTQKDLIVKEAPLTILVNGQQLVTILCSPQRLEYLAAGFLLFEGLVKDKSEIIGISLDEKNYCANIRLNKNFQMPQDFFRKRLMSPGCCQLINSKIEIRRDEIYQLMEELERRSLLFKVTGGAHSAAICNQREFLVFTEDISRYNTISKVFGECLLKGISTEDKIILTSGRISSEILTKVAKQRVPIVISHAAPTDLAVRFAERLKITLVGFVRGKKMNIYTCDSRVI